MPITDAIEARATTLIEASKPETRSQRRLYGHAVAVRWTATAPITDGLLLIVSKRQTIKNIL